MRGSYLLILLLSALLLVGAKHGHATSQKDRATKHERESAIETAGSKQRDHEAEVLLSAIQAEQGNIIKLTQAIKDDAETRQEQERAQNKSLPFLSVLTGLRIQQGLLIVGVLYTVFAGWQLLQIRRQANIAYVALRANRPFLLVKDAALVYPTSRREDDLVRLPASKVTFINYGKSPAIIRTIVASFEPATWEHRPHHIAFTHQPHKLAQCSKAVPDQDVIIPDGSLTFSVDARPLPTKTLDKITESPNDRFVVYGRVQYVDVFNETYWVEFCLVMMVWIEGWFDEEEVSIKAECRLGPREHNRHKEN